MNTRKIDFFQADESAATAPPQGDPPLTLCCECGAHWPRYGDGGFLFCSDCAEPDLKRPAEHPRNGHANQTASK